MPNIYYSKKHETFELEWVMSTENLPPILNIWRIPFYLNAYKFAVQSLIT
jgi:hypothetical protein